MNSQSRALLDRLATLSEELDPANGLEPILNTLAIETARILDAENASLMLAQGDKLQVHAHHGRLPEEAYNGAVMKGEGVSGHVLATGQPVFVENIEDSPFSHSARYPESSGKSLMSVPLFTREHTIGVLNVSCPRYRDAFSESDLKAFRVLGRFATSTIQATQLRSMLHSRFAITALATTPHSGRDIRVEDIHDPEKLSRILAKSFYRELRQMGFSPPQIINSASEIISELSDSLRSRKEPVKKNHGESVEARK